jgi:hypothetical protein
MPLAGAWNIFRVGHALGRQPKGRKPLCIERDPQYGDMGSHRTLKIESSDFLIMTQKFALLFDVDACAI